MLCSTRAQWSAPFAVEYLSGVARRGSRRHEAQPQGAHRTSRGRGSGPRGGGGAGQHAGRASYPSLVRHTPLHSAHLSGSHTSSCSLFTRQRGGQRTGGLTAHRHRHRPGDGGRSGERAVELEALSLSLDSSDVTYQWQCTTRTDRRDSLVSPVSPVLRPLSVSRRSHVTRYS